MSDNNKPQKKVTDDYMAGLGGAADSYIKIPVSKPAKQETKFPTPEAKPEPQKEVIKQEVKPEVKQEVKPVVAPKIPEKKPEAPRVVVPTFIKKDTELEKEIVKIIQEVPKEELERILRPNKESKDRLLRMEFQNRGDMSEEEKKDFIEQIAKKEPAPEIAEMNGALVWKWQKNRRTQGKKDSK